MTAPGQRNVKHWPALGGAGQQDMMRSASTSAWREPHRARTVTESYELRKAVARNRQRDAALCLAICLLKAVFMRKGVANTLQASPIRSSIHESKDGDVSKTILVTVS